jgi:hypothetical protein
MIIILLFVSFPHVFLKIRHYCERSASIVMAVPLENPIVAANIPLVLSHLPGGDASAEALRLALLGVAAIQYAPLPLSSVWSIK